MGQDIYNYIYSYACKCSVMLYPLDLPTSTHAQEQFFVTGRTFSNQESSLLFVVLSMVAKQGNPEWHQGVQLSVFSFRFNLTVDKNKLGKKSMKLSWNSYLRVTCSRLVAEHFPFLNLLSLQKWLPHVLPGWLPHVLVLPPLLKAQPATLDWSDNSGAVALRGPGVHL